MKIEYVHDVTYGYTYALEIPSKDELINIIFSKEVFLMAGKSTVHPDDTYSKKIGRETVNKRLKKDKFVVNSIVNTGEGVTFSFSCEDFLAVVILQGDKVKFINAF